MPSINEPSPEELRRCISLGFCWWCKRGGWRVLTLHTSRAHNIYADGIREMAGLKKGSPTCTSIQSRIKSSRMLMTQGKVQMPRHLDDKGVVH